MLEREIKLGVAREDLAGIFRLPCVARRLESTPKRRLVRNFYHDTPAFDLRAHGLELRLRRKDGRWLQTVKAPGGSGAGLHQRAELEFPVAGRGLDFGPLLRTDIPAPLRDPDVQRRLERVFETRYWRRSAMLAAAGGGRIEISVDLGEALAGPASLPICEVELELKRGDTAALYELAEELADEIDARLNPHTKPDLGYRLIQGYEPVAVFGEGSNVRAGEPAEEVFARFLGECARHAFANEEAILAATGIEGVHQMRVGLRRLRACLSLFRPLVPGRCVGPAREAIGPLLDALGPARDWDVFIRDRIDRFAETSRGARRFRGLRRLAAARRETVYGELRTLLRSREHHRTRLRLLSWIARSGWRADLSAKKLKVLREPAGDFVRDALRRSRDKALGKGRKFRRLAIEELHRLRIAVKRHRYPVEFFAGSFPGGRTDNYAANLKLLQTELGRVNDVSVAAGLLEELAPQPGMNAAVEELIALAEDDRVTSFTRLPGLWREFRSQKVFWKKPFSAKP